MGSSLSSIGLGHIKSTVNESALLFFDTAEVAELQTDKQGTPCQNRFR